MGLLLRVSWLVCLLFFSVFNSFSQDFEVLGNTKGLEDEPVYTSLKKALKKKDEVRVLNLSNQNLSEFPTAIFELKKLAVLYLDSNNVSSIPDGIENLKELIIITASYNHIQSISDKIDKLYQLKLLDLSYNELTELSPAICRLSTLVFLNLDNNAIEKLPVDVKQLGALETLRVSQNKLKVLPDEFKSLYNIITLDLSNNSINELPEQLFQLTATEYLYLEENGIKNIPSSIGNLKNLKVLLLRGNELKDLPDSFYELFALKTLSLANNKLDTLPKQMDQMINLNILDLSDNPFTVIPDPYKKLKNLKKLYIENHKLATFPQVLYDIQNNNTKVYGIKTKELFTVKLLLSKARNNRLIKEYDASIANYNEVLGMDTNNIQAMIELTSTYLELNNYDSALVVCERGLQNDPPIEQLRELKILHNYCKNKTSKDDVIVNSFETVIDSSTNKADANFDLGRYYFDKEEYSKSLKYFEEALKIDPSHGEANFYYAVTNKAIGNKPAFVFSVLRFVLITEKDKRTSSILPFLMTDLKMKIGVKGKDGSTHYYDNYVIRNNNNEIVYQSENAMGDLAVAMLSELLSGNMKVKRKKKGDEELAKTIIDSLFNSNMNNVQIMEKEFKKMCSNTGGDSLLMESFYYKFYYPFYKSMIEKDYLEVFSYLINAKRSEEKYIMDWLKENAARVEEFNTWVKKYSFSMAGER